jgi:hypothetical protein
MGNERCQRKVACSDKKVKWGRQWCKVLAFVSVKMRKLDITIVQILNYFEECAYAIFRMSFMITVNHDHFRNITHGNPRLVVWRKRELHWWYPLGFP